MYTDAQPPISQEGRTWAYVSYGSIITGLPLFIVPFVQRNDAFAVYHAKQAAAAYIGMWVLIFVYFVITMVTCGVGAILAPMVMLPYVPMIHGFVLVSNGEWKEPAGVFGLGDAMFGGVQVEQK